MFDDAKQDADLYFAYFDATIVGLGFVANVAALVVVPQCRFQMAGYRRFLISLTVGGLFTCIINALLLGHDFYSRSLISVNKFADNQPLSQLKLFQCIGNILRTLKLSCFLVSLLNLCGMSLDHYIGIMHPMRYHEVGCFLVTLAYITSKLVSDHRAVDVATCCSCRVGLLTTDR